MSKATVRFGYDLDEETTVFSKPIEVKDLKIEYKLLATSVCDKITALEEYDPDLAQKALDIYDEMRTKDKTIQRLTKAES